MTKATSSQDVPLTKVVITDALHMLRHYPLITIFTLIILRFLYRRYASPLRKYPGPFLASGTRLWAAYRTSRGHVEQDYINLHKRYGPIVRNKPNQISFSSPEAAREILSPGKGFHKTDFYWVFPPAGNPDIFTEISENKHAVLKKFAGPAYSLASFQGLTPAMDTTIEQFCQKLDSFAAAGADKQVDLGAWLHYFAFDVLGRVAFSTEFGFLEQGRDVEDSIAFIDEVQTYDGIIGEIPELDYVLRRAPYWDYLPFVRPLANNVMTKGALEAIGDRQSGKSKPEGRDLLEQLLEGHAKDPEKFTVGNVFAIAHGAIGAGSDSTASTMQTFFHSVLSQPQIFKRLTEEILTADSKGELSDLVTWEQAQKSLPYFQACLKEAMRTVPAVGLNIARKVPPAGAEIDGAFVPGGVEVAINAHVLHRNTDIFGADADKFRPERWLVKEGDEKDEARVKRMDRYMFQVRDHEFILNQTRQSD